MVSRGGSVQLLVAEGQSSVHSGRQHNWKALDDACKGSDGQPPCSGDEHIGCCGCVPGRCHVDACAEPGTEQAAISRGGLRHEPCGLVSSKARSHDNASNGQCQAETGCLFSRNRTRQREKDACLSVNSQSMPSSMRTTWSRNRNQNSQSGQTMLTHGRGRSCDRLPRRSAKRCRSRQNERDAPNSAPNSIKVILTRLEIYAVKQGQVSFPLPRGFQRPQHAADSRKGCFCAEPDRSAVWDRSGAAIRRTALTIDKSLRSAARQPQGVTRSRVNACAQTPTSPAYPAGRLRTPGSMACAAHASARLVGNAQRAACLQ